ncbi:enhanced entry protein EnhB (plasmid) [Legionella adelaidensis]|uniref:Enhanced entry protein EnhB n=1 Tax=Legionella adelaidensis TaxID=45056 RepID=A0A0W0R2W1_9GAMM|nr:hypothetical protein [Legionella adelaidensis]KTC65409.1 enhanced entry protein EnhB [Legionella adelaidensis]VEH84769.1 enhanced entry protein EnhB [Legionella adelaidensis]
MKNKLKFLTVGAVAISLLNVAFAAKETEDFKNPFGCRDAGYHFDLKILELLPEAAGERQSLYFILNKQNLPVSLYQMRKEESSRNLFLNSTLNPMQWSVLSTAEKSMKYICTVPDAKLPYGRIVDCGESLQICEYVNVVYGLNNRGAYWIVKNTSRSAAVSGVVHYGIIPK